MADGVAQGMSLAEALADPAHCRSMGAFGLEIDFDLSRPLSSEDAEHFRQTFYREKILRFRAQSLSMKEQERIVTYVGAVLPGSGSGYLSPEDKILGTSRLDYHSDLCATPMPIDVISLHGLDIVENTSTTDFVSGARAYALLSEAQRSRIAALEVNLVQTLADKTRLTYDVPEDAFNLVRPLVMEHRITGERIIYASISSAARIEGFGREESAALLGELFEVLYDPSNEVRHSWRPGDFLIWDNLALQHGRPPLDPAIPRRMQRVASGRRSLREQVPGYNLSTIIGDQADSARAQ